MQMIKEDQFFQEVSRALQHDQLILPSMPEIATRVDEIARCPHASTTLLATEVARDPAIAVRLMRVANSAYYGRFRRVENLPQAITLIGLQLTRQLVSAFAMQQMFRSRSPALQERLHQSWQRSTEIAAICKALVGRCTTLMEDTGMLAGLIHDVGVLPIIRHAEAMGKKAPTPEALERVLEKLAPKVGTLVLRAWGLPYALCQLPLDCQDFTRRHSGPADYVDVVTVALLQSVAGSDHPCAQIDPHTVPAFEKLGLANGPGILQLTGFQADLEDCRLLLAA